MLKLGLVFWVAICEPLKEKFPDKRELRTKKQTGKVYIRQS